MVYNFIAKKKNCLDSWGINQNKEKKSFFRFYLFLLGIAQSNNFYFHIQNLSVFLTFLNRFLLTEFPYFLKIWLLCFCCLSSSAFCFSFWSFFGGKISSNRILHYHKAPVFSWVRNRKVQELSIWCYSFFIEYFHEFFSERFDGSLIFLLKFQRSCLIFFLGLQPLILKGILVLQAHGFRILKYIAFWLLV